MVIMGESRFTAASRAAAAGRSRIRPVGRAVWLARLAPRRSASTTGPTGVKGTKEFTWPTGPLITTPAVEEFEDPTSMESKPGAGAGVKDGVGANDVCDRTGNGMVVEGAFTVAETVEDCPTPLVRSNSQSIRLPDPSMFGSVAVIP